MGYGRRGHVLSESVTFSAPTRIDLAGGTLDIWPVGLLVPRAATVNAAISLRARATVSPGPRFRVVNQQRGLDLSSTSAETFFRHPFAALAGRLLDYFRPADPVEIRFETTAPPGSGLGGSSSLAMAIAGALNEVTGAGWTIRQLVRIVMDAEVRILRTATGSQDQLAAGLGGTRVHHWVSPEPRSEPLPWLDDGADPLEKRFVLVYTGEAHSSADPNGSMLERIFAGEPSAVRGIEVIAEAAYGMRDALLGRDWERVSEMLDLEWGARRALSEMVTTATIERLSDAMRQAGARAVKVCGAGGGGTMIAIAPPEKRSAVVAAASAAGGQVLEAASDAVGLRREAA
ncbi:MAG: hypothetical protein OYL41_03145 [Acidobacteriota bacterium]|nr:hypothetical protein [Acidobacteriota bacterium]